MFILFPGRPSPYQECRSCTLPYIENVNGRNGFCDGCGCPNPKPPSTLASTPPIRLPQANTPPERCDDARRDRSYKLF